MNNLPDEISKGDSELVPAAGTLGARWWQKLGLWSIISSNPNSWASAAANVLHGSEDDFVLLQETKLHKDSVKKVAGNTARRLGWSHCLGLAHKTGGYSGSGGCGVLA